MKSTFNQSENAEASNTFHFLFKNRIINNYGYCDANNEPISNRLAYWTSEGGLVEFQNRSSEEKINMYFKNVDKSGFANVRCVENTN